MAARRIPGPLVRAAARALRVPGVGAVVRRVSSGLLDLGALRAAGVPDDLAPLTPDEPSGTLPQPGERGGAPPQPGGAPAARRSVAEDRRSGRR